ncbi:MAG: hypothetical protein V7746_06385 [Halioglobus sp.]
MDKLVYPVWKSQDISSKQFSSALLGEFKDRVLAAENVRGLKICVVDEAVADAAPYRMEGIFQPGFDATVLVWLDDAAQREGFESALRPHVATFHGYLVGETDQLPDYANKVTTGQRTPGMNQVVFLKKPDRLDHDEWLDIWQQLHTPIAIDTQSTFGYRQNVVKQALTAGAPDIDAIVEENFPHAAISNRAAFYDALDNEALYRQRETTMIESCARFIDFDKMDCIPTSEYFFK